MAKVAVSVEFSYFWMLKLTWYKTKRLMQTFSEQSFVFGLYVCGFSPFLRYLCPTNLKTQEGKHLPVEHCIKGTTGWELSPALATWQQDNGATVLEKVTFGSKALITSLVHIYETEGIESIELIGLCTDICVVSNALAIKAFLPEVPIVVDASCCAGVTPEKHLAALETMASCQVQVINQ